MLDCVSRAVVDVHEPPQLPTLLCFCALGLNVYGRGLLEIVAVFIIILLAAFDLYSSRARRRCYSVSGGGKHLRALLRLSSSSGPHIASSRRRCRFAYSRALLANFPLEPHIIISSIVSIVRSRRHHHRRLPNQEETDPVTVTETVSFFWGVQGDTSRHSRGGRKFTVFFLDCSILAIAAPRCAGRDVSEAVVKLCVITSSDYNFLNLRAGRHPRGAWNTEQYKEEL